MNNVLPLGAWALAGILVAAEAAMAGGAGVVFEGKDGPGCGKHIVFVTGDEEYRSEESMPQLAKILALRHGFKCTVLFAIDPKTGEIDPLKLDNIPGLEALRTADLMVLFVRFRELPDAQMKEIIDYTNSGRPIVAFAPQRIPFGMSSTKTAPLPSTALTVGPITRAVMAGKCWARRGSTITATTKWRAPVAWLPKAWRTNRLPGVWMTSGDHRMSMNSRHSTATACPSSWDRFFPA